MQLSNTTEKFKKKQKTRTYKVIFLGNVMYSKDNFRRQI